MAAIPDNDPGKPQYAMYAHKIAMLEVLFPTSDDVLDPQLFSSKVMQGRLAHSRKKTVGAESKTSLDNCKPRVY